MEKDILIKAENVSKKFCKDLKLGLLYGLHDLTTKFSKNNKEKQLRKNEFWAVDNISFEVKRGECLGLLGHNGAGKSTLLKVITGLIAPDRGKITMRGRVNALIELTAGFNPILTGRENIYNNGAVLGLSKKEIDEKFDEIVEFSELEEFIDTPVQYYSSGMKVRLGFSVAVFTEPDVLILDEVLSVGDAGFQIKSYNKMREVMKSAAVIFVSHSMQQVTRTCSQVLFMRHGKPYYIGSEVHKGISLYFQEFDGNNGTIESTIGGKINNFYINDIEVFNSQKPLEVQYGTPLKISFNFEKKDLKDNNYAVILRILDKDMKIVGSIHSGLFAKPFYESGNISVNIPKNILTDGEYTITYIVYNLNENRNLIDDILCVYRDYIRIRVTGLNLSDYTPLYFDAEIYKDGIKYNI